MTVSLQWAPTAAVLKKAGVCIAARRDEDYGPERSHGRETVDTASKLGIKAQEDSEEMYGLGPPFDRATCLIRFQYAECANKFEDLICRAACAQTPQIQVGFRLGAQANRLCPGPDPQPQRPTPDATCVILEAGPRNLGDVTPTASFKGETSIRPPPSDTV
ncbi:hypothetical protein BD310DRAFT_915695 [Dichomitus squalens]|uniref:Uncharacterized protein n=1 Tax=Dichomitus squalens TaxID=114155 RepID=A0A4Q9Q806_9APHY|nr:hypothetical protein BD310DRAFT_915695 [Dichomitus squalens]